MKLKKSIASLLLIVYVITSFTINVFAFSPRTIAPSVAEYNKSNPYSTGQCTWYAWGRAREILGKTPYVWKGNA